MIVTRRVQRAETWWSPSVKTQRYNEASINVQTRMNVMVGAGKWLVYILVIEMNFKSMLEHGAQI